MVIRKRGNKPSLPKRKVSRKITIRHYGSPPPPALAAKPNNPETFDKGRSFRSREASRLIGGITHTQLFELPHLLTLGEFLSIERVITEIPGNLTTITLTAECREQTSSHLYSLALNANHDYTASRLQVSTPQLFRYGDVVYNIISIEHELRPVPDEFFTRMTADTPTSPVINRTMIMVAEGSWGTMPYDELIMRVIPNGNTNTA